MKKFLNFCICEIMSVLLVFDTIFCALGVIFLFAGSMPIWMIVLLSGALTVLSTIVIYLHNKDYFEQLYNKVCRSYKGRDDYKNFVEIKEIIMTYEFNGKKDVKRNVAVIQASIERDNAFTVFWSALLTIFGVILGIVYGKDSYSYWYTTMYLILFAVYLKMGRNIPRNSFIKKVLDTIVDE
ncbi:MAG: hypothetical protein ACI4EE_13010 [Lachnospiraceae bacterium]